MNNPTRRNRNIGTAKQGYKKPTPFVLPYYRHEWKVYFEKLSEYTKVKRKINGEDFTFVVEKTRENCFHACTIDDVEEILKYIPLDIYDDLRTIVFRQPKRKEEILSPVWGRLVFGYELESDINPAIILESFDYDNRILKRSKKLNPDGKKEIDRLINDGFEVIEAKRNYEINITLENVRNVQLYRTLPHEIGHYVQYIAEAERFDSIPSNEREVFAHRFADTLKAELKNKRIIPFPRKFNTESLINDGLDPTDFQ